MYKVENLTEELVEKYVEKYGEDVRKYFNSENCVVLKIQLYSLYDYRKYEEYRIEGYCEETKTEIMHSKGKFLTHIEENKEQIINKETSSITTIEDKIMYVLFLPGEPAEIKTIQKKEVSHRCQIKWEDEIIEYFWDGEKLNIKRKTI
ncbi:MAG: hypothetical protein ACO2O4_03785 [Minisyncoccia bacterium]|jgi:hypothetical protein